MTQVDYLGRLRAQLGELLNLLEDEQADPVALARALQTCGLVFDALKAGFPSTDELDDAERERLAAELERTLRLNAVALSRAARSGEDLARGISRTKLARRHAGALAGGEPRGATLDRSA